jgi:hypothetical protein
MTAAEGGAVVPEHAVDSHRDRCRGDQEGLTDDRRTAHRQPTASSPQDVAASFPTAADDPQQLTQEIHETREQLGETVEELADKADVTAPAEDKTSQLSGRLQSGASQANQQAAAKAGCCAAGSQATCPGRCRTPSRRPGRPESRSGR